MLTFYKKATAVFIALLALTLVSGWFCLDRVFLSDALLPPAESAIPWNFEVVTDTFRGGTSSLSVTEETYSLEYEYLLTDDIMFPYVMAVIAFADLENAKQLVDLSKYFTATFKVKCSQLNVMTFYVHSFDEQITDPQNFYTYRFASALFSCDEGWSEVEIDLKHLTVPLWWLEIAGADLSDRNYWLDKVVAVSFDASRHGPLNVPVEVKISDVTLHGRDWRFLKVFVAFSLFVWAIYIAWVFKLYTATLVDNVKGQLKKDQSLIAYQQLSFEPHINAEKNQVLKFMATEYANPNMSLEFAMNNLGLSRTKINELLKDEFGFTFSVYLNKLRLAEAARLLSRQREASVAEIAYLVGYKNVTYFNKLFKKEYGCSPKVFKDSPQSPSTD